MSIKHVTTSAILVQLFLGHGLVADEIDSLAARLKPVPRFSDYQPDFRVEARSFTFRHAKDKSVEKHWSVVMDGDKYVALVRSGDFNLIALTPELAKSTLNMPAGRYHLDTQLGPTLATHQFLKGVNNFRLVKLPAK